MRISVIHAGTALCAAAVLLAGRPGAAASQAAFAAERWATAGATPTAVHVANDPTDAFVPGFTTWFVRTLDRAVEDEIAAGASPGAVLVVGHAGEIVLARGWGRVDWAPDAPAATPHTLYDLASVTKVAATTVAMMVLVEEGRVDLDRPLHAYLDGWPVEGERSLVTVRHLLTHRSGLPAGAAFWRRADTRREQVEALAAVPLEAAPGARTIYSDLGPILLGFVVEAVTGETLDGYVERRVYAPLGMGQTAFRPLIRGVPAAAIAPTERIGEELLHGVVHDPSARALDGVAGNAGLFASAADLAILASALLWERPARLVCRDVIRDFTARADTGDRFGTGWEMPAHWAVWSETFSPSAFGHTGFTGTSLWIDPENDLFVVLLTNRVNPTADNQRHHDLRRVIHDHVRRGHLREEEDRRAADWRWIDAWRGADSCRAEAGMEMLGRLGNGLLVGWPGLRGR